MFTMKVRDMMTTTVVTATPETPLKEVARRMVERAVSGIPVVDAEGRVLGVVSEADFLLKERGAEGIRHRPLAWLFGESRATRHAIEKVEAVFARDAMTSPAVTIAAAIERGRSILNRSALRSAASRSRSAAET